MSKTAKLPIYEIDGHLLARKPDDVWAIFAVSMRSYRAEPRRRQQAVSSALTNFAVNAQANFQILRVSRRFDAREYADGLRANMPPRAHRRLYNQYVSRQQRQLESLQSHRPLMFLCYHLANPRMDIKGHATQVFDQSWDEFRRKIRRTPLSAGSVGERASVALARVQDHLDARPATREEVCWLVERGWMRGIAEPDPAIEDWAEPRRVDRLLADKGVVRGGRHVICQSESGDSYQSVLCMAEIGDALPFTRKAELMFASLEEHPWPVDASLNLRWVSNAEAIRRATRQVARMSNALKDEEFSYHGARETGRSRFRISDELYTHLTESREPLPWGTLSLVVPAASREELDVRVRAVKERFPWPLKRPYADHLEAWAATLPGQPPGAQGFMRPFTCEQIGAMVPLAAHEAGSLTKRAFYIGKTLHGHQPVLFDLAEGSLTETSPTIALCASQGGGKTTLLSLLEYQAFLQGARVVDVDPKGGHRGAHRFHEHPDVREHAEVITLGPGDRHAGMLDPLRVASPNERHEAAITFLTDVLPRPLPPDVEAMINGAITQVLDEDPKRACCTAVIDALEGAQDAEWRQVGKMLRPYSRSGLARLGFATPEQELPTETRAQVTYLNIAALKRSADTTARSEMSVGQRWGRAVLTLVALYSMRILGEEPNRLKVLGFDETSFLSQDAAGRQLLDILSRWGRSEYAVPILSTQLLSDVDDQDNLVGHWFFFKMKSPDEARRALRDREFDDRSPLIDWLTGPSCEKGRGLYRDLRGHSEQIQVDLGNWGLLEELTPEDLEKATVKQLPEEEIRHAVLQSS